MKIEITVPMENKEKKKYYKYFSNGIEVIEKECSFEECLADAIEKRKMIDLYRGK